MVAVLIVFALNDMIIEKHFGEEGGDNGRPQKMLL